MIALFKRKASISAIIGIVVIILDENFIITGNNIENNKSANN